MYRILIADDERLEREALAMIVRTHCAWIDEIDTAPNGRTAAEFAREHPPDIAVLDIRMPGLDGIESAGLILEAAPSCRLVFLTAFDYFDFAQSALRLGASDFLLKPADTRSVVALLDRLRISIDAERERRRSERDLRSWTLDATMRLESDTVAGLVLGTVDAAEFTSRLELFDIHGTTFAAVATRPDYDRYALPVTSRSQRKLIDRRAAAELVGTLRQAGVPALATTALSVVYVLAGIEAGADTAAQIRSAAERLHRDHHLLLRCGVSAPFHTEEAGRRRFLEARDALFAAPPENSARPVVVRCCASPRNGTDATTDAGGCPSYPFATERRLVHALRDGHRTEVGELFETLLAYLERAASPDRTFGLALYELLVYLRHSVAMSLERSDLPEAPALDREAGAEELSGIARGYLQRLADDVPRTEQGHSRVVVDAACRYMREHFDEELTLEAVAEHARVSSYHLSRLFRTVLGTTFVEHLTSLRIERAKQLLSDGDRSMKEVSTLVGYADPNYFSKVFRKHEGVPPSHFRDKKMLI